MSGWPVIYVDELIPDIKPGTRGLCHISSKVTKRLNTHERKHLNDRLKKKAIAANVRLFVRTRNRVMMIGWTPK